MREVSFVGAGDDTVIVHVRDDTVEYPAYENPYAGRFVLVDPEGATMAVHVVYDGTWAFAVALGDEDVPLPEWETRLEVEGGYSMRLVIEAPDDVAVF